MKITALSLLSLIFYCAYAADAPTQAPAPAPAPTTTPAPVSNSFQDWADKQYNFSVQKMFDAIKPKPDALPGTIMASPTVIKPNPDYYYHWVRDASLTMDAIAGLTEANVNDNLRMEYFERARVYNKLTDHLQSFPIPEEFKKDKTFDQSQWLGEPKWNMDGTAFLGKWMRPQNDGPATRAFATVRFTKMMLHRYLDGIDKFYGNATNVTPLMKDLEYTAANWRKPSYEIWEEVKGNHFYTYMVQRRAMLDGAALAVRLKDFKSARKYRMIAKQIEREISTFWSPSKGYITVTKRRVAGLDYKRSELDSQTVLASLHAGLNDGFFTPESDKVLATWYRLVRVFSRLYPDNIHHRNVAPAIGRYPEDRYNGYNATLHGGNGWMLITAGMAECVYRVHINWRIAEKFTVTSRNVAFLRYITSNRVGFSVGQRINKRNPKFARVLKALIDVGDSFMQNVRLHTEADGMHLSEQWNRKTGKQQGAQDLTWSYTSFVTAYHARKRALMP